MRTVLFISLTDFGSVVSITDTGITVEFIDHDFSDFPPLIYHDGIFYVPKESVYNYNTSARSVSYSPALYLTVGKVLSMGVPRVLVC